MDDLMDFLKPQKMIDLEERINSIEETMNAIINHIDEYIKEYVSACINNSEE